MAISELSSDFDIYHEFEKYAYEQMAGYSPLYDRYDGQLRDVQNDDRDIDEKFHAGALLNAQYSRDRAGLNHEKS